MQDECYNSSLWMSVRVPGKVVKVPTGLKACPTRQRLQKPEGVGAEMKASCAYDYVRAVVEYSLDLTSWRACSGKQQRNFVMSLVKARQSPSVSQKTIFWDQSHCSC